MLVPNWRDVAQRKTSATLAKIHSDWILPKDVKNEAASRRDITGSFIGSLLSEQERIITGLSSSDLVRHVRQRKYTAREVTLAYTKRAAFAHQLVSCASKKMSVRPTDPPLNNCLHEIFFEEALKQATEQDEYLERTGQTVGPMHGLPVSLKDQFHVKSVGTTMGYVGWVGTFEGEKNTGKEFRVESQIVQELRSCGAILYCKTSCPQTLMLGETINNLIGRTMNPISQKLSCGGSSGGEGALLALGASSVGVGTDIGGSVRIPASFCGTFSIKPSFGRFSYRNVANTNPGQTLMPSAIGFMSTSLQGLELIMKSLLSMEPWLRDPDVAHLPWRDEQVVRDQQLCFGVWRNDGTVTPHPPVARGVDEVVEAVKKSGHKIIDWMPPSHVEAMDLYHDMKLADGGAHVWRQLNILREPLLEDLREDYGTGPSPPAPLLEYQADALHQKAYAARYLEYWNSTIEHTGTGRAVDAVILPVAPHAAVIPGKYFHYGYTEIHNLLDFTGVVIPVTRADKSRDRASPAYKPMNDVDRKNWDAYDPEAYHGAPVGVQFMGRKFSEERTLAIAAEVTKILSCA